MSGGQVLGLDGSSGALLVPLLPARDGDGCPSPPRPVSRSPAPLTVGDIGLLSSEGLCFMGLDCLSLPMKQVLFSLKSQSSFPEHGAQMSDFYALFPVLLGRKKCFLHGLDTMVREGR